MTEDHWGTAQTVELKPNGSNCNVINSNVDEYIQLQMRYRLLERVKEQVKALLIGFYEVIPEVPCLTDFILHLVANTGSALCLRFSGIRTAAVWSPRNRH